MASESILMIVLIELWMIELLDHEFKVDDTLGLNRILLMQYFLGSLKSDLKALKVYQESQIEP